MTQNITRVRRQRRPRTSPQIPIPHSSWSRLDHAPDGAPPVKPEEFWSRLGI